MPATLQNIDCVAGASDAQIQLTVFTAGLTVTIIAGTFTLYDTEYTLPLNVDHLVTVDPTNATDVVGMLVLDGADPLLLVDEIIYDGVDEPYDFSSGSYTLLHTLYVIHVPAAVADLDATTLKCFNVVHPS